MKGGLLKEKNVENKGEGDSAIKIENFSAIFLQLLFSSFIFLVSSVYGLYI